MIGRMILQGLAATVIVAIFAFGYAASAKVPVQDTNYSEASR